MAASEDAATLMEAVQLGGGQAAYALLGADRAATIRRISTLTKACSGQARCGWRPCAEGCAASVASSDTYRKPARGCAPPQAA